MVSSNTFLIYIFFQAGLGDVTIISPAAVMLLARKISAVSGDVRKALDVCRRSVQLLLSKSLQQSRLKPAFTAKNCNYLITFIPITKE